MTLHWRPLWRAFTSLVVVAVPTALILLFAWFSRNPDHPAIDRAAEWPYVGSWIGRLQAYWTPEPIVIGRPGSDSAGGSEPEVIIRYYPTHVPSTEYVWLAGGTALRTEPSPTAEPVLVVEETTNLFVLERRGDWVKVHRGAVEGWVLSPPGSGLVGRRDDRPEPVLPLPGRSPDAEDLRRALESFSSPPVLQRVDPYLVYTDLEGDPIGADCRLLVAAADERWARWVGIEPVGEAAEAVLLFSERSEFGRFRGLVGPEMPPQSEGMASAGMVATYVADRSGESLCRTLLHEIAHLLTRRSLGPALPSWLDEGLAVGFAAELLGLDQPFRETSRAVREGRAPDFESLADLAYGEFHGASRALHYELSALWVRYLLEEPDLAAGFRRFLAYLSRGGPWAKDLGERDFPEARVTPTLSDDLLVFLDREGRGLDAERLEAGFRAWLWARGAA